MGLTERRQDAASRLFATWTTVALAVAVAVLVAAPGATAAIPQQSGAIEALDPLNLRLIGPDGAGLDFGSSVAFAGDVNGDGDDDLLVGARDHSAGDGGAYVVYGGIAPGQIDLGSDGAIDPERGFRLIAPSGSDLLAGRAVSAAGDFNDDGYDDVLVGANGIGGNQGGAFLVFGAPTHSTVTLDPAGLEPEVGTLIHGPTSGVNNAGISLAGGDDVNGDGIDDVIVSSGGFDPGATYNTGASFVVYGAAGNGATVALDSLPADRGFKVVGDANSDFQEAVGMAGDVNGDGIGDVIVGATGSFVSTTTVGYAAVVYGSDDRAGDVLVDRAGIDPGTGFMINGAAANDGTGAAVAGSGDVDGDGYDDVVVGAPETLAGSSQVGAAYVIYGGPSSGTVTVDPNGMPAETGFTVLGPSAIASPPQTGSGVSGGADLNGDGLDDTVIAAHGAGYLTGSGNVPNVGEIAVVYGVEGGRGSLTLPAADDPLNPADGFVLHGPGSSAYLGNPVDPAAGMHAVSAGGDFNADGRPDLAAGAARYAGRDGLVVATLGFGPPSISYGAADPGIVGEAFSLTPEAIERTGPASFTVAPELPDGLALDPVSGEVSGTPTAATEPTTYTITMTDLAGEANAEIELGVEAEEEEQPPDDEPSGGGPPLTPPPGTPPPSAAGPAADPAVTELRLSPRRPRLNRRGRLSRATLRFTLGAPASVGLELRAVRKRPGCRGARRCRRLVRVARINLGSRPAGVNSVSLKKPLRRKKLRPGRYRLTLTATAGARRTHATLGIGLR